MRPNGHAQTRAIQMLVQNRMPRYPMTCRMRKIQCAFLICLVFLRTVTTYADPKSDVEKLLGRTILAPEQTLADVQKFSAGKNPPLPAPATAADLERSAKALRNQTMLRTVYPGETAK